MNELPFILPWDMSWYLFISYVRFRTLDLGIKLKLRMSGIPLFWLLMISLYKSSTYFQEQWQVTSFGFQTPNCFYSKSNLWCNLPRLNTWCLVVYNQWWNFFLCQSDNLFLHHGNNKFSGKFGLFHPQSRGPCFIQKFNR